MPNKGLKSHQIYFKAKVYVLFYIIYAMIMSRLRAAQKYRCKVVIQKIYVSLLVIENAQYV